MRPLVIAVAVATGLSVLAPFGARAQDPVVHVSEDDPVMNAAIAAARKSLPGFLKQAVGHLGSKNYLVKYAYPLGGGEAERIWVTLLKIDGNRLSGELANDGDAFDGRAGDPVKFKKAEVLDWSYWGSDGLLHGAYTTRAILPKLDAAERKRIKAMLAPPEEE